MKSPAALFATLDGVVFVSRPARMRGSLDSLDRLTEGQ
jgi:hypothetical protein